jgi:hypothetical protein
MAFRTMRAILMNFPVNYEEAEERTMIKKTIKSNTNCIPTKKTVSWKLPGAGASHTPQECVGKSRFSTPRLTTDRWFGVARIPHRAGTARRTEQVRSKQ